MLKGFANRLHKELIKLQDNNSISSPTKIIAPPERKYSTWIGASVMANHPELYHTLITSKEEYNEHGPAIVHKTMLNATTAADDDPS